MSSKPSKVEAAKSESRNLRGTVTEVLQDGTTDHFGHDDIQVLKFHGIYQQSDRDQRKSVREGEEKQHSFMIRVALPGGILKPDQYLTLDRLSDEYADGTIRVTTRQAIQYHGVVKDSLKPTISRLHGELVSTLAACGDIVRNVMACPACLAGESHQAVADVTKQLAKELLPATNAYHEIWLDGEKVVDTKQEEKFYGSTYLPRKFKIAVAAPEDNCVDVYTQDTELVGVVENGEVTGFNILVGGGQGMTNRRADTFATLGSPLGYVAKEHAAEAVRTVVAVFRDAGNRSDRKHARLKYLIDTWGFDKFRQEFIERFPFELQEARPLNLQYHDHLGRHLQADGRWLYGIWVENGRVKDAGGKNVRSALRRIVEELRPEVRLSPHQNVLLCGLEESQLDRLEQILSDHGVPLVGDMSAGRRRSMACPALPTCGLALAESERLLPSVMDGLEEALKELKLWDRPFSVRMTGCPNGCARPYTADLAFVGRSLDMYQVYVGGRSRGDRMADLFAADVPTAEILDTVRPLLEWWATEGLEGEELGDFYRRQRGETHLRQRITGKEVPSRPGFLELRVVS